MMFHIPATHARMLAEVTKASINASASTTTKSSTFTKPTTISIQQIPSTSTSSTTSSLSEDQDFDHDSVTDSELDSEPFELITAIATTGNTFTTTKAVLEPSANNAQPSAWEAHIAHGPFSFYSSCSECVSLLARRDAALSGPSAKGVPIVPAATLDVPLASVARIPPSSYEEAQEDYEPQSDPDNNVIPVAFGPVSRNSAVAAANRHLQAGKQDTPGSHAAASSNAVAAKKAGCGCWYCNGVDLSEAEKPRADSPMQAADIPRAATTMIVPIAYEEAQEDYVECVNNVAPGCVALPSSLLKSQSQLKFTAALPSKATASPAPQTDHENDASYSETIAVAKAMQLHAQTSFTQPRSVPEDAKTAVVVETMQLQRQAKLVTPSCYEETQDANVHGFELVGQEVVSVQVLVKEDKAVRKGEREVDVIMVDEVVGYGNGTGLPSLNYEKKQGCGCWYCG